jgi:uncharacterized damage-inducible protein DinB
MKDSVIKEMHAIKDANARRHRGNVAAFLRGMQRRQAATDRVVLPAPRSSARPSALKKS